MEPERPSVPSGCNPSHLIGYTISNIISLRYSVIMASLLSLGLQVEAESPRTLKPAVSKRISLLQTWRKSRVKCTSCWLHSSVSLWLISPPLCSGAEPQVRPIEVQSSHILIPAMHRRRQNPRKPNRTARSLNGIHYFHFSGQNCKHMFYFNLRAICSAHLILRNSFILRILAEGY